MGKEYKDNDPHWERRTVTELAWAGLKEQRRARRWGVFFKILTFAYLAVFLMLMLDLPGAKELPGKDHTAVIKLKGLIADGTAAGSEKINKLLRTAFEDKKTRGVVLEINSPGGTPVEAVSIYDEIRRLRKEYPDIKLYAVVRDLCASGGYYIASAADEIYANESSIVGSIGVRMDGFGFEALMTKLGIERRTITAGKNKALLDPFKPEDPAQRAHVQAMLEQVHQKFIDDVKAGRGDRLKPTEDMFSGLIWSGKSALDLGLIDGFADTQTVAREQIGVEHLVTYEAKKTLLKQLADDVGGVTASALKKLWTEQAGEPILLR